MGWIRQAKNPNPFLSLFGLALVGDGILGRSQLFVTGQVITVHHVKMIVKLIDERDAGGDVEAHDVFV